MKVHRLPDNNEVSRALPFYALRLLAAVQLPSFARYNESDIYVHMIVRHTHEKTIKKMYSKIDKIVRAAAFRTEYMKGAIYSFLGDFYLFHTTAHVAVLFYFMCGNSWCHASF